MNKINLRADHLQYVLGLCYGKCTTSFLRKKAKKLEPWLCVSIILHKRPLDLYCREEDIDNFVVGLSEEIKRYNPQARVFSLGKYIWYFFQIIKT